MYRFTHTNIFWFVKAALSLFLSLHRLSSFWTRRNHERTPQLQLNNHQNFLKCKSSESCSCTKHAVRGEKMLDLNLNAENTNTAALGGDGKSVTSTTTTSADDVTSTRHVTLNFSILKNAGKYAGMNSNEVIEIEEDDAEDDVFYKNELQLFPLAASSGSQQGIRDYKYWLDLSVPERIGLGAESEIHRGSGDQVQPKVKKSRRGPRSRSSQYRGVTFYRRTGRWESHIWDCGKQVYLGGFDTAHAAARAYDRAALKFRGVDADINFSTSDYEEDMKQMKNLTKEEFVHVLRRQVSGSAQGGSKYRGISIQKYGRWEARMGQFLGKKSYDKAAITNNYDRDMKISLKDGGSEGGLDLNLGMSLLSDGPQGLDRNRSLHFPYASLGFGDGKSVKIETNSASTQEMAMATQCSPPMWPSGVYAGFAPNKVRETGISGETGSHSPGNSSWSYKMGSAVNSTVPPHNLSSAASSGFSSPSTSPYLGQLPKSAFRGL